MNLSRTLSIVTSLISVASSVYAQTPSIQWEKAYGGTGYEGAYSIQQTFDNGFIMSGYSNSHNGDVTLTRGGLDCWVVKTDSNSNILWQKTYGGSGDDFCNNIQPGVNGTYIIAAWAGSADGDVTGYHGSTDAWIINIDDTGRILWQKDMGSSGTDWVNMVRKTADSGYIAVGVAGDGDGDVTNYHGGSSDAWVIKLTAAGTVSWAKTYGGSDFDAGYDIRPLAGGGYIFTGQTQSTDGDISAAGAHGQTDGWVVKLDDTGAIIWSKTYGGSSTDDALTIQQTTDGGYVFTGAAASTDGDVSGNHGGYDYWVVKLDDAGAIQWSKCYGGVQDDFPGIVLQTPDEGYVVSGMSKSTGGDVTGNHGALDYWLIKLDNTGALTWEKSIGGSGNDTCNYMALTSDNGYVLAGSSRSTNDDVTGNHGQCDMWVVKVNAAAGLVVTNILSPGDIKVYPTITTGIVNVVMPDGYENAEINMFDLIGNKVMIPWSGLRNNRTIQLNNLAAGMYFLQIVNKGAVQNFKLVYQP